MAEEVEMGADTKEGFTEVDEGGNVEDRIRIQMDQLNPIKIKKATEEVFGRQSKSSIKEVLKNNNFIGIGSGERLTKYGASPDEIILRQDKCGGCRPGYPCGGPI